ncbi:MAG: L,D-transpeptidase family protein [Sphingomonadales bacterium]|nr:L,D-transpeptidase family protein [Sphingomonadales bacterium]MBD3773193.1 L,D-transpeptidase family protein [Paracoccaceae bacterium]
MTGMSAPSVEATPEDGGSFAAVAAAAQPPAPPPAPPAMVADFLTDGVVIVISKPSQRMYVFEDGVLWRSSPVSTGKRGHTTPSGVFAILQKKTFHRSNIYSNAPMPFMQRLTWTGIAIHAGHLPGYPASHGCIRLPGDFARDLYSKTDFVSTAVIVTDEPIAAGDDALRIAGLTETAVPLSPKMLETRQARFARADRVPAARLAPAGPPRLAYAPMLNIAGRTGQMQGQGQTIQLAAATSQEEAAAHWQRLTRLRPELSGMQMAIVPAVVNARQYYRLRATAPDAAATCRDLKRSGIDCFAVS